MTALYIHPKVDFERYIGILSSLKGAVNELRDDLAKQRYSKSYKALSPQQQKLIRTTYKFMIVEKLTGSDQR